LIAIGAIRWHRALPHVRPAPQPQAAAARSSTDSAYPALDSAAVAIVSNDPFRLANEPAAVRYDANDDSRVGRAGNTPPPAPLRPTMKLKAIVGGPPWQAVVDGIPGQPPGTIVRTGSTFDRLLARRVTRDSVLMQGPDTTWVLTFQRNP
jgi:hypothetical protein